MTANARLARSGKHESRTAVIAAFLGNGCLAVLKGIAAAMTGSAAMLAETLHSIADTGNQALLLVGMRLARRPPDERHPFGHGRDVYFWAFVVAVIIFSVGGGFAIWEAVRTFLHPAPHDSYAWAYAVLAGAAVFESISFAVALRQMLRDKGARAWRDYVRDVRDPTIVTVVLEDGAALLSIAIAAAGLTATYLTDSPLWDAVASAAIGVLLIAIAVVLAFDNYSLLLGESAPREVERRIRDVVDGERAVDHVTDLQTLHIGPDALIVALSVHFRNELRTPDIELAVDRLEHAIQRTLGSRTNPHLVLIEASSRDLRGASRRAGEALGY